MPDESARLDAVAAMREAANRGIDAANHGRGDVASVQFERALELAEEIDDGRTRRDEISVLSTLLERYGFAELALPAAEEALATARALELEDRVVGQDLIAVGNAHNQLENTARAEALYRQALDLFVGIEDWANAASASTNLAGVVGNGGDLPRAATLLETSLTYLERAAFDETEINTRLALMQVYELIEADPGAALDNAERLCDGFWQRLHAQQKRLVADFVMRLTRRHPEAAAAPEGLAAWAQKRFPMI
ncbi:MAG: hypothetical protein DWQ36_06590 [Acidobacteria bacterium]|nr:MAG: hypothetical protein DWQ30_08495 [Acidobacteriota bacterium]REK09520.1 MAG: hypothetical protein DWQ36_06590 [Acidobacteriota bacterium]